jgi:hypothetical protein
MDILAEAKRIEKDGVQNDRDFAIGLEIMQQYSDRLGELLDKPLMIKSGVDISISGQSIRFDKEEDFFSFAAGIMHKDKQ